jgi:hypothetical protein
MSEMDRIAPGGIVQLNDVPGSLDDNAMFDSLFPADSNGAATLSAQQTTQPAGTQTVQQQQVSQQTQTTVSNEPFLKGSKSVYKTSEAAVEGINQKDALIDTLRQRYALTTGIDPITGQPVGQMLQNAPDPNNYASNPDKYMKDLYEAAKSGPENYAGVQQKFIMDSLRPLQPIIASAAKNQALENVSRENAEIPKFVNSDAYNKTLDANQDLKDAIATSEADVRFHSRLPGLYKLAYLAGQGMQVPEILKATTTQTKTTPSQTQQVQQPVRTTMNNGTLAPPTDRVNAQPSFKDINGIRATIAAMEAKGVNLTNW